jgi:hypothetical protein
MFQNFNKRLFYKNYKTLILPTQSEFTFEHTQSLECEHNDSKMTDFTTNDNS